MPIPVIDPAKCTACEDCLEVCPPKCMSIVSDAAVIEERFCEECGECAAECTEGAITIPRD